MAESDLSLTFTQLMSHTAEWLGYGYKSTTGDGLTAGQVTELGNIVNSAYRRVLIPPMVPGYGSWQWTFLEPQTTLLAWASEAETSSGDQSTTVTAAASVFVDTMIGHTVDFTASGVSYTITDTGGTSVTAAATCTVSSTAISEGTGKAFTITANGDYRLPDDFGGINGSLSYVSDVWSDGIKTVPEQMIRQARSRGTTTGKPSMAAIVPVIHAASTSIGQRFDLQLWPMPDSNYTLKYHYRSNPQLLSTSNEYPAGGAQFAELYRAACLAEAETTMEDSQGVMERRFLSALASAVQYDASTNQPDSLGYNQGGRALVHGGIIRDGKITYEGTLY